jgi:hypothetical protein
MYFIFWIHLFFCVFICMFLLLKHFYNFMFILLPVIGPKPVGGYIYSNEMSKSNLLLIWLVAGLSVLGSKLMRKPSLERELHNRGSPALDSGAGSSRSDSPRQVVELHSHPQLGRQYSPGGGGGGGGYPEPPPPPPPRSTTTPPPPPPPHAYPPLLKRMSPRGTSPVHRQQPMIVQNNPQVYI